MTGKYRGWKDPAQRFPFSHEASLIRLESMLSAYIPYFILHPLRRTYDSRHKKGSNIFLAFLIRLEFKVRMNITRRLNRHIFLINQI